MFCHHCHHWCQGLLCDSTKTPIPDTINPQLETGLGFVFDVVDVVVVVVASTTMLLLSCGCQAVWDANVLSVLSQLVSSDDSGDG